MAGFIELIAKIKPKNNGKYALVDDVDVEMEDGSRLSEAIKKPKIPDGGKKGQILAKKSDANGDGEWVDGLKMEDVDKKIEGKLDKNLGKENPDKVLTTDSQGNIVLQDKEDFEGGGVTDYNGLSNRPSINGITLIGNKTSTDLGMYTKEEVDEMLYEKMDKPYAPIAITNDATIEDCLDGYFKIDKIKGNVYQAEETDIVPTPQRQIPINSRKTKITKVNPNVFDLEKESNTSNIPDTGTYRSIGQYQLKANTEYIFEWSEASVPAKATLSFQIQDDKGTVLVSPFTYFNLEATEKKEVGKQVEFTTNESGIIKFAYNCIVGSSSSLEIYQQYWYTEILKDITLKENVTFEPEYVELRSLKESKNLFDNRLFTLLNPDYFALNDDGTGIKVIREEDRSIENIQYEISIRSLFYCHFMCSGGLTITIHCLDEGQDEWRMVKTCDADTTDVTFSVGNDTPAKLKFEIHGSVSTETANIALYSYGVADETKYIPPTARDYKIVDHENRTAKIIRNVGLYVDDKTGKSWGVYNNTIYPNSYLIQLKDMKNSYRLLSFCNSFNPVDDKTGVNNPNSMWMGVNGTIVFIIKTNFKTLDEWKEWLKNNDLNFLYPLATPIEENIAYVETDTSEVGYSWQDTTSPSPDIPSEARGVEKIDILKTGRNLFDVDKIIDGERLKNNDDGTLTANTSGTDSSASNGQKLNDISDLIVGKTYTLSAKTTGTQKNIYLGKSGYIWKFGASRKIIQDDLDSIVYFYASGTNTQAIISEIQIEQGETPTAYEPYTEQYITITPPQPLYSTVDGSVADEVDVEKGVYRYRLLKDKIGNIIDSVTLGDLKSDIRKWFTNDLKNESLIPIRLSNTYDTKNLVCANFIANVEKYRNASDETFSLYEDNTAMFVGSINVNRLNEGSPEGIYNFIKDFEVVYPLLTPIEIPIPEEDLAKLKSLRTNAGVNNIFINGEVKPVIEAMYAQDIALVINRLQTKLLTLQEEVVKNV